jgi:hypothetical protein
MLPADRSDTNEPRDPSRFHGFLGAHPPRLRTGHALRGLALVGGILGALAFPLPPNAGLSALVTAAASEAGLLAPLALAALGLALALVRGQSVTLGAARALALATAGGWALGVALPRLAELANTPTAVSPALVALLVAGAAVVARMHRPDHWTPRLVLVAATGASLWLALSPDYGPASLVPVELHAALVAAPRSLAGWSDALPSASQRVLALWYLLGLALLVATTALALARPDPLVDLTRSRVLPAAWSLVFYLPATLLVWLAVGAFEQGALAELTLARAKLALIVTACALWVQFGAGALYHQLWSLSDRSAPSSGGLGGVGPATPVAHH